MFFFFFLYYFVASAESVENSQSGCNTQKLLLVAIFFSLIYSELVLGAD